MLAISVDDLSNASGIVQDLDIPFPVLYDPSGTVPRSYEVFELLERNLAAPATFVLDKDGVIRWRYIASDIGDRPPVSLVLRQLSEL